MTKRMNISIPDNLYENLQEHKMKIKVSKICQDALASEIEALEIQDQDKVKQLVNRLRKERISKFKPFFDEGFSDGQKDAYEIDLEGFEFYQEIKNEYSDIPAKDWPFSNAEMFHLYSTASDGKYTALADAQDPSADPEDRKKNEVVFYEWVEGDLIEKGFFTDDGPIYQIHKVSDKDECIAIIYHSGWLSGLNSILSQAEYIMRGK